MKSKLIVLMIVLYTLSGCSVYNNYIDYMNSTNPVDSLQSSIADEPHQKDVDANELDNQFYYRHLDGEEQALYTDIYNAFVKFESELNTNFTDIDKIDRVYRNVLMDHPEIYWVDKDFQYHIPISTIQRESNISLSVQYIFSEEELPGLNQKIDDYVQRCLVGLEDSATDYEKVLHIYEYVIRNTIYDLDADYNQQLIGVVLTGRTVCAGYTKIMQYILDKVGIPSVYTIGSAEGELHSWNLLSVDGENYFLDATWGDQNEEDFLSLNIDPNICFYDYFLVTSEDMLLTHYVSSEFTYPDCHETKYNYYMYNQRMVDEYDLSKIKTLIEKDLQAGKSYSTFRFASRIDYVKACTDLLENNGLYALLDENLSRFYSTNIDGVCTIHLWFEP